MSGGENEQRRQAILSQILNYLGQSVFVRGDNDRAVAALSRRPEDFITPQPDDPFWEDVSRNYENVKEQFGLVPAGELDELLRAREDQVVEQVRNEIRDQIAEFGIEEVADALQGVGTPPDALQERVDDVLEEFPPDVYDAEIRDRAAEILTAVDDDLRIVTAERLETARQSGERETRREVLTRLSREFNEQFDGIDEAVEAIRSRIRRAQEGEDVLAELSEVFGREIDSTDEAIEVIREESGISVAREEVLDRLNSGFGLDADTLDEAISRLNDQLVEAQRRTPEEISLDEPNERAARALALLDRDDEEEAV